MNSLAKVHACTGPSEPSEIKDFKDWLGLSMPLGQPLSPEFQIPNFLAKLYVNLYHIKKIQQSLQWLARNSPDKISVVLGTPVGQP